MEMTNNSNQVQQLGQNLNHHILAYLRITQRQVSLKVKNFNRCSGFDILMASFLFGLTTLQRFLEELNKTHPNLKFKHELSK